MFAISGAYATLTTRKLANMNIPAIIEDISYEIGTEVSQVDVKNLTVFEKYIFKIRKRRVHR